MEIKVMNKTGESITFVLKGVSPTAVNMLRRMIIEEVPVLAIEEVTFQKNSSALYDEIIAHRLGLIPLKTDLESYSLPQKCKCKGEGCAQCQLVMSLKTSNQGTVYAEQIASKDPKVKPVFPKMPIVKLIKKQALEIEAKAVLGQGKDHAKFIPGNLYYKGYPSVNINKQPAKPEEIMNVCPTHVFKADGGKLKVDNAENCILCDACVDATDHGIEVKQSDKDFIVTLESFGQLSAEEILTTAVSMFDEKLEEFGKLLSQIK